MREIFVPRNFKTKLARLEQANAILADYAGQGWQLFYQFVARQLVENMQANYDALGNEFRGALAKAARRHDQTSADIVRKLLAEYLRSEGLWK
jgi:hypothetical protein